MELATHESDLKALRQTVRHHRVLNLVMGVALSLAVLGNLAQLGSERTIVVPPTISKTFWLTSTKASGAYLEEMASFASWLILDVAPPTIDWKTGVLLNYVSPEEHGEIKRQQDIESERIKRLNATTYFLPMQIVADEAEQAVRVVGRLRTTVNGQETNSEMKAYLAGFKFSGGRLQLQRFEEVPYANEGSVNQKITQTVSAATAPDAPAK